MRKIVVFCTGCILLSGINLLGQIDPEARRGVYLNFEEESEAVDLLDVVAVGCDDLPVFEVVENPDRDGNFDDWNTANVGKITTTACTNEGIQINNEFLINFSPRPWIAVDVFAPAADLSVVLRLEDFNDSETFVQREAITNSSGTWERLEFDFSGEESGKYGRIVMLVDTGGVAAGEEWYFDNIKQRRPPFGYSDGLLVNFEDKNPWWHWWGLPQPFEVIDNIDPSGLNPSAKVGTVMSGASTYEGIGFYEKCYPFDFTDGTTFSLLVYAPAEERTVRLKLERFENKNDNPISVDAITTKAFEWEMLEFDFADLEPESDFYSKVTIFPDYGSDVTDEEWFFDDIKFYGTPTEPPAEVKVDQPVAYQLAATNYPNPFNPSTTISYAIPKPAKVNLTVYDMLGKVISTLVNEEKPAGTFKVTFDGSAHATGVYFYTLSADNRILTRKMLLIK